MTVTSVRNLFSFLNLAGLIASCLLPAIGCSESSEPISMVATSEPASPPAGFVQDLETPGPFRTQRVPWKVFSVPQYHLSLPVLDDPKWESTEIEGGERYTFQAEIPAGSISFNGTPATNRGVIQVDCIEAGRNLPDEYFIDQVFQLAQKVKIVPPHPGQFQPRPLKKEGYTGALIVGNGEPTGELAFGFLLRGKKGQTGDQPNILVAYAGNRAILAPQMLQNLVNCVEFDPTANVVQSEPPVVDYSEVGWDTYQDPDAVFQIRVPAGTSRQIKKTLMFTSYRWQLPASNPTVIMEVKRFSRGGVPQVHTMLSESRTLLETFTGPLSPDQAPWPQEQKYESNGLQARQFPFPAVKDVALDLFQVWVSEDGDTYVVTTCGPQSRLSPKDFERIRNSFHSIHHDEQLKKQMLAKSTRPDKPKSPFVFDPSPPAAKPNTAINRVNPPPKRFSMEEALREQQKLIDMVEEAQDREKVRKGLPPELLKRPIPWAMYKNEKLGIELPAPQTNRFREFDYEQSDIVKWEYHGPKDQTAMMVIHKLKIKPKTTDEYAQIAAVILGQRISEEAAKSLLYQVDVTSVDDVPVLEYTYRANHILQEVSVCVFKRDDGDLLVLISSDRPLATKADLQKVQHSVRFLNKQ